MRRGARAALLGSVALAAGLAGCIEGKFFPAEIPRGELADGWAFDAANSDSGEAGLEPLVRARWNVNAYQHAGSPPGAAFVISVSDVPVFDEQGEIQKQLDARLAERRIELVERVRGTGRVGGDEARFVVSDATRSEAGATLRGLAVDVAYACSANAMAVRVFGFAVIEVSSPILGERTDRSTWEELAGRAVEGELGGMVTRVRCS